MKMKIQGILLPTMEEGMKKFVGRKWIIIILEETITKQIMSLPNDEMSQGQWYIVD